MVKITDIPMKLQMVTTRTEFRGKVVRAMHKELVKRLTSPAFQTSIRRGMKPILEIALRSQPEYEDMVAQDGKLRAELGVVDSASAMESLVSAWVKSTNVVIGRPRIIGFGPKLIGTIITVRAIQADYQDVLDKAWASYQTEKGQTIPWLDWLLTRGSEVLVSSHHIFHPASPTARSRTGTNTIMQKTKGRGWGVPPQYSGTPNNNYATRAVAAAMQDIEILIEAETKRRF